MNSIKNSVKELKDTEIEKDDIARRRLNEMELCKQHELEERVEEIKKIKTEVQLVKKEHYVEGRKE